MISTGYVFYVFIAFLQHLGGHLYSSPSTPPIHMWGAGGGGQ